MEFEKITRGWDGFSKVNINMYCEKCSSDQTFNMIHEYNSGTTSIMNNVANGNLTCLLQYNCAHCKNSFRYFTISIDPKHNKIMKTGQYPAEDISINKDLRKSLGKFTDYYRNGRICENFSYGIGAYGYYRRIVEGIIDDLLENISDLIDEAKKEEYKEALEETKKTIVAQKKIELVKDLIPSSLCREHYNPLQTLHSALSEGLHGRSDEECLDNAEVIRISLEILVERVIEMKDKDKVFTENMKKILKKKQKRKEEEKSKKT